MREVFAVLENVVRIKLLLTSKQYRSWNGKA